MIRFRTLYIIVFFIIFIVLSLAGFYFLKQEKNVLPQPISGIKGRLFQVRLTWNGFEPQTSTISAGDSIEFITQLDQPFWPASDLHPTHGIYPEFDPLEEIAPTSSWKFQFLKSGRWKFHDHLQPQFKGTIVVS